MFGLKAWFIGISLLFSLCSYAQVSKFKALFIYNFTKYLDWPPSDGAKTFNVNVIGEPELLQELKKIAEVKKVGNKSIIVNSDPNPGASDTYHLIFINGSRTDIIEKLTALYTTKPTLFISDCRNCLERKVHINFLFADERLGFEINRELIEQKNIKTSMELINLSKK